MMLQGRTAGEGGGFEALINAFSTSALDGVEWSTSRTSNFAPGAKISVIRIEYEVEWAQKLVWGKREDSLLPAGTEINFSILQPVV
jgi:hypothetical protein